MKQLVKQISAAALATVAMAVNYGSLLAATDSIPDNNLPAPPWPRDLVVCEISTKGFTPPNGPKSGTFASMREKIPYLKNLGINRI